MRSGRRGRRKWTPDERASRPSPDPTRVQRPQPPPPTRAHHPQDTVPTADEAPTGAVPVQPPPPPRGARPYHGRAAAPPPWRSRRAEPPYEHYDTGGYPPGHPRDAFGPDPTTTKHGFESAENATRMPKKLTVTRVAALRGRELSGQAVAAFRRAATADGADKSGLTSLTYSVMLNYASDAAMAVALANTLFFAASSGESRGKVALYLLITIAPFALVAPVIGPALDRIQRGRRLAMAAASAGQALMCVLMALNFDSWVLYPAALGKMVLSKSFMVLKAAVTPRVLPPEITLSKTNARLAVFGLAAGGAFGAVASGLNWAFGSAGALWFTALICAVGAAQAMRIPSWVEVTEGEVPASLTGKLPTRKEKQERQPMARHVVVALWGNGSIRVLTGFLMMFAAFAVKAETEDSGQSAFVQLLLLGIIGAAAGVGGFLGNALGSRMHFGKPDQVVLVCLASALAATIVAAIVSGIATAALVGLVGSTASALAKNSLDAVIQQDMPEESRASAFGRSETVLQLAWVFGGAVGLLLPPTYWIGFLVVSALLALGLTQTWLVRGGSSLVPSLRGRAVRPDPGPDRGGS
ncbi:MFS transporter [Saccharomonospora cyanea]|uniref:Arabinose efflux permease family protein n=1 Tax=Saccharomonospora cyanea NA-134 TaxID=882082 RepID=H5XQ42_9PSEU|nr:MFS transporter [Saccharomonospora cyanea]EHR63308.1 arabinose efflux permease family protein [Saccharomonospora cyanea NA-134]